MRVMLEHELHVLMSETSHRHFYNTSDLISKGLKIKQEFRINLLGLQIT